MTDAVVMQGIGKEFGDVSAVRDFSLRVPSGCIYGFLGPNGAGKTTIIRMIMGIFYPDRGHLSVLGTEDPVLVKERVGYLPEEKGLYKKMRVAEMVAYFGQLKGMDLRFARERAEILLREFGLGDWIDKRCETLSKGMGQKVQLLITLIHQPDLVILDEPFSGLDPVNRDLMRDAVLQLKREGKTVLFSTHIMEQAEQICDYVVLINKGIKVLDGALEEVRESKGQAVLLDYDGDGSMLAGLSGVRRVNDAGKQAELFLEEGTDPQQILGALLQKLRIRRFDLRAPSLHEIFIRTVGEQPDE